MSITQTHRSIAALSAALPLVVGGCNRPPYELAGVTGVVKLNGKPTPDLIVAFLPDPDKGTRGPRAAATTDAQGHYRLACDDGRPGAVVGHHFVLVTDARASLPEEEARKEGAVFPPSRLAMYYGTVLNTPLRQEVKAGGPQMIDLSVTSK